MITVVTVIALDISLLICRGKTKFCLSSVMLSDSIISHWGKKCPIAQACAHTVAVSPTLFHMSHTQMTQSRMLFIVF